MDVLAVALGGAAGSVLRFWVQSLSRAWLGPGFPWGTLAVNLSGSLLIGIAAGAAERGWPFLRLWAMTGLLGGFTTFSAFSFENVHLIREGQWGAFAVNAGLNVAGGAALAFAGYIWFRPAGA